MDGMATVWMRMPGQSWPGAAAGFLGMWTAMMVAMMLPSFWPVLARCRRTAASAGTMRCAAQTMLVSGGYFLVWTLFGLASYPLGIALMAIDMRSPALAHAIPMAVGAVVLVAGALQFTAWKARQLACCRQLTDCNCALQADGKAAWRHGLRLGLRCCSCCSGLTATLFAVGLMDLRAMTGVTAAITFERLAPARVPAARFIGIAMLAAGLFLIAGAACRQP